MTLNKLKYIHCFVSSSQQTARYSRSLNKLKQGFTLVELLVVMTLLGIIAVAIVAAINPIEQANRARDTRFKSDSGQLVSAIERYYTQQAAFPWGSADTALSVITAGSTGATGVGVCGTTCASDGALITANELKQEFRSRDFIRDAASTDPTKTIQVLKAAGASSTIYACYRPLSISTRQRACTEGKVYTISGSTRTGVTCTSSDTSSANWTATSGGWFVCLPE